MGTLAYGAGAIDVSEDEGFVSEVAPDGEAPAKVPAASTPPAAKPAAAGPKGTPAAGDSAATASAVGKPYINSGYRLIDASVKKIKDNSVLIEVPKDGAVSLNKKYFLVEGNREKLSVLPRIELVKIMKASAQAAPSPSTSGLVQLPSRKFSVRVSADFSWQNSKVSDELTLLSTSTSTFQTKASAAFGMTFFENLETGPLIDILMESSKTQSTSYFGLGAFADWNLIKNNGTANMIPGFSFSPAFYFTSFSVGGNVDMGPFAKVFLSPGWAARIDLDYSYLSGKFAESQSTTTNKLRLKLGLQSYF